MPRSCPLGAFRLNPTLAPDMLRNGVASPLLPGMGMGGGGVEHPGASDARPCPYCSPLPSFVPPPCPSHDLLSHFLHVPQSPARSIGLSPHGRLSEEGSRGLGWVLPIPYPSQGLG